MSNSEFDDEIADMPMPTPKEMIADCEECLGVPKEIARKIAGFDDFRPRMGKELEGQRRSRTAQQLLRRVKNRIRRLIEVEVHPYTEGRPYPAWAKQANLRTDREIMALYWVRGLIENGGCEPIEWAPELEPSPESVEVQA